MRYYIIAGEASGDLHASNFVRALRQMESGAVLRGWGGELMQAAGVEVVKHYRDLAFMGFVEVVKNLGTILDNFKQCKRDILAFDPDVVILVDYPGFNLRMAQWLKGKGIRVFYYISPQIWAWHTSRVKKIKDSVDRMFVILPFEKEFYARYGMEVDFVGHPLLDVIDGFRPSGDLRLKRPVIALLPGSRKQEIVKVLPEMLSVTGDFSGYQFVIAGAPNQPSGLYDSILGEELRHEIPVFSGRTYDILAQADAALVTSGTATLETALFGVPQIVCYKGNPVSYAIAKRLVKVEYISLVNLIMGRPIVRELIQRELSYPSILQSLRSILEDPNRRKLRSDYEELRERLGRRGASERLARLVTGYLSAKGG